MSTLKKKLSSFDMFPASPILRAQGETEIVNLCSSVFSIIVFACFVYIFASATDKTIKLQNISAVENIQMNRGPDQKIGNITMAIGLQWLNFSQFRNIFQARIFSVSKNNHFLQLAVFPCERQMWRQLTDSQYNTIGMDQNLCIQKQNVEISGWFGAENVNMIYINISQCSNLTSPIPCASQAHIDYFFNNYLIWGRLLACSFYILDARFNPNQENVLSYTIYQKTIWLIFNKNQFTMLQLFLGVFEINTDTSFLPYQAQDRKTGYYVSQSQTIDFVNNNFTLPLFFNAFIYATPVNKVITRSYGKIDDVLSYVGGLFGIIMSFFSFFLISFNQYKYQLRVSQGAFSFKDRSLAQQSNFHFLKFVKYVIYDWTKSLTCYQPDWDDCRAINQAREEAIQQIDVKHLLQRINHIQKVNNILVNQQKQTLIYLSEAHSIEQVKGKRMILNYCHKFSGPENSMTINDFQKITCLFNFAISNSAIMPQENYNNQTDCIDLKQQQIRTSFEIMGEYIQKHKEKLSSEKNVLHFDQEQIQTEKKIAASFFNSEEEDRIKVIRNIPLSILYRLSQYRSLEVNQQNKKNNPFIHPVDLKPLRNPGRIKKRRQQAENLDSTFQFKN